MINRCGLLMAAFLGLGFPGLADADQLAGCKTLRISGNPEFAPWSWQDGGELRGASIRIAEQVAAANGVTLDVRFTGPLKRNIALLRGGALDLLVALPKTLEREKFVRFTEYYAVDEVVLVKRRDASLSYVDWDDMRNLTIATTRANSWGEFLDAFLEKETTVYRVPGLDNVMRMVLVGRADFGLHRYYSLLPLMDIPDYRQRFSMLHNHVNIMPLYMGFGVGSPCATLVDGFNETLGALRRNGTVSRIVQEEYQEARRRIAAQAPPLPKAAD